MGLRIYIITNGIAQDIFLNQDYLNMWPMKEVGRAVVSDKGVDF